MHGDGDGGECGRECEWEGVWEGSLMFGGSVEGREGGKSYVWREGGRGGMGVLCQQPLTNRLSAEVLRSSSPSLPSIRSTLSMDCRSDKEKGRQWPFG